MAAGDRNSGARPGFAPRETFDHSSSSLSLSFLDLFRPLAVIPSVEDINTADDTFEDVAQTGGFAALVERDETGAGAPDLSVGVADTKFSPTGTRGFEEAISSGAFIIF